MTRLGWGRRHFEKPPLPEDFWNLTPGRAAQTLSTGLTGLSESDAAARIGRYGPNDAAQLRHAPLWLQYLARFKNPLVLILLAASAVSAATGETASFVIIAAVIVLSVTLDFVQEVRAERAVEALRRSVAITARTCRDGKWIELRAEKLVPGDLVELKAGDLIPADGLLLEARDLYITQAILTGEPYPVEKRAAPLPAAPATGPGEADNAGFLGTSVVSGVGHLLVCRTGRATILGGLAKELGSREPITAFETGIRHFGLLIMRLTALLVLFVLLVNGLLGRPLLESFLFAIALAVGLTPELLPMVTTVTLARGALRLARRRVIVKHLPALHNLGAMDLLCTDKTGTLTEAQVRVDRAIDADGAQSAHVLDLAWLNSHFSTGVRSPLDAAILASPAPAEIERCTKLDEVPFDFERRRVSILIARDGQAQLLVKGAPENLLRLSSRVEGPDGTLRTLDAAARHQLTQAFDKLSEEGLRALGVAYKPMPAGHRAMVVADEADLIFAGFVAFIDPPKREAAAVIHEMAKAQVAVKILTGDNEHVTRHLCASLGLKIRGILTGDQVAKLTDEALFSRAARTDLYCRLTPQQKTRVVLTLRRAGHVVGFLGDGINDAPALHAADIGISVDSAADVAKEAADLILLEHDLEPVRAAVEEGRRSFENILKYILMGTSSNFGNMFSMAGATLFLPFLPMLPVQVLVNNLLYDLSELGIPFDRVDPVALARPHRWDMAFVQRFMWTLGPVSSLFDFLTFFILLYLFKTGEALFQTGWFVESMLTQTMVVLLIRTRGNPFANRPDRMLTATVFAAAGLALLLPYTPLGHWLGMVALPIPLLGAIAGLATAYFLLVEQVKRMLWRRFAEPGPRRQRRF